MEPQAVDRSVVALSLAGENYGIDIEHVREVAPLETMTATGSETDGLMKLHDTDVPVVDLRRQLEVEIEGEIEGGSILVADIDGRAIGLLVDAVTGVHRIRAESVKPAREFTSPVDSSRLGGVARVEGDLLWLIDIERVFTQREKDELFAGPTSSD